jgi:tetratricopeptide (TPR) repeat protein
MAFFHQTGTYAFAANSTRAGVRRVKPRARTLIGLGVALVIAILAVYADVRNHDFVDYDDFSYVVENDRLRSGLGLRSIATDLLSPYFMNWSPVTMISFRIDFAAHGLSAPGYLMTNVALHAIASLLLLLTLARATGSVWPAAFVAFVFAIHPLHVESVAWISSRKDVLSGAFFAAALFAYARFVECPDSPRRKHTVTACVVLALLSKATAVTLPVVLLLLDYWPLDRLRDPASGRLDLARIRAAVVEKRLWFSAAIAVGAITVLVQNLSGTLLLTKELTLGARLHHAIQSYGVYLARAFWPTDLAAFYPYDSEYVPSFAAAAIILIAISAAAFRLARTRPYLLMGWLWFAITLLPMIGIVQAGLQAQADRYMYLPLIGPAIAVAWGVRDVPLRGRARIATLGTLALLVGVALASLARSQVSYWRTTVPLFERALAVTEGNFVAHKGLAVGLLRAGNLERAREHFEHALRVKPDWPPAQIGLGDTARLSGKCAEAVEHYERALAEEPHHANALTALGLCYIKLGRPVEALPHLERANRLGKRSEVLTRALAIARDAR